MAMQVHDPISVDLLRASKRSEWFPSDWSEGRRKAGLDSYRKFLLLAAKNLGRPVAPTKDIDVFWHLHMLHPQAYYDDCQRLMGRILDHDGGFGATPDEEPILAAHFAETGQMWEQEYGEPYALSPDAGEEGLTKCWHNCQSRCHNACKSNG